MESISYSETVTTDVPGPNKRVFAFLVDGIVFSVGFTALAIFFPQLEGLWRYFLWSVYFLLRDALGASLGKRLASLTIVDGAGQPAGGASLIIRNLPIVIPFVVVAEYFVMRKSSDGRRWGDRWANTRVQDRRPEVTDGRYFGYSLGLIAVLVLVQIVGGRAGEAARERELAEAVRTGVAEGLATRSAAAAKGPADLQGLTDADPAVRVAAANRLGENGGSGSVAALLKAMKDPDARVHAAAVSNLSSRAVRRDPEIESAVPELTAALDDPVPAVRMDAASALGRIGPGARSAVPALVAALQKHEPIVSFARALARIDVVAAREHSLPLLVSAYSREKDGNLRSMIVDLLGDLEAPPDAVVPTLIRALDDQEAYARYFAVSALGKIGPPAAAAIPGLTKALKDPDKDTREAAVDALAKVQGK